MLFGPSPDTDGTAGTSRTSERATHTAADVLFGATSPSADAPGSWTTNVIERELYGADHAAPTELYSVETALRPALHERQDEVMTVLQIPQTERIQRHRAFVAAIRDAGLDGTRRARCCIT